MLVCEACDKGYHTSCMEPATQGLPTGSWKCKVCPALTRGYRVPAPSSAPLDTSLLPPRTAGSAQTVAGTPWGLTPAAVGPRGLWCVGTASSAVPRPMSPRSQNTHHGLTCPPRCEWGWGCWCGGWEGQALCG